MWFKVLGILLILFGLGTLKSGSAVLFFDPVARVAAGHYVPFVLWSNFIAGFFYIITGAGIYFNAKWSVKAAVAIALFNVFLFVAFGFYILNGKQYELRTVGAMVLRTSVWIAAALLLLKFKK